MSTLKKDKPPTSTTSIEETKVDLGKLQEQEAEKEKDGNAEVNTVPEDIPPVSSGADYNLNLSSSEVVGNSASGKDEATSEIELKKEPVAEDTEIIVNPETAGEEELQPASSGADDDLSMSKNTSGKDEGKIQESEDATVIVNPGTAGEEEIQSSSGADKSMSSTEMERTKSKEDDSMDHTVLDAVVITNPVPESAEELSKKENSTSGRSTFVVAYDVSNTEQSLSKEIESDRNSSNDEDSSELGDTEDEETKITKL